MQRAEAMEQARLASQARPRVHRPRFPEPLPFTTIGTAAITPPESPLDGIPTTRMENVAGRIHELLAISARAGVHLSEDVAGRAKTV